MMAAHTETTQEGWSESDLDIIRLWKHYGAQLQTFCDKIMANPWMDGVLPVQPKTKLTVFYETEPIKLRGAELHNYLVGKVVVCPQQKIPTLPDNAPLDMIKQCLVSGYRHIKGRSRRNVCDYLDYGALLNLAYKRLKAQNSGCVWHKWLRENVRIEAGYASRLRLMEAQFGAYHKIRSLSISFSELYNRRQEIAHMLKSDIENGVYWL